MIWRRLFPFLFWPRPTMQALRKDAWAGISVGLVLVPQALAYATLAGMPPETGLYAALIPSVIGVLWGSSPLLAVGPVALTSLLTFASLQPLATPGSAEWVQLAIWLAIYSGLIQFALGATRLGAVANFVSFPVVSGFINAAALIIMFSQLPALLGLPAHLDMNWFSSVSASLHDSPRAMALTAAFGVGSLVFLMLQKRLAPRWPGVLMVSMIGIGLSALIGYGHAGAAVVGEVPGGLPPLALPPSIGFAQHRALLPAAIIIALISFTEAMSSCRTLARGRNERWDENQELIGQGL
ncbi:MAG: SulP family inorganic anion transporter, partial [Burkholderiales bacterium]